MLWNLFEISINAYESFLMIYFLKSRLHIKEDSHLADILCLLSCTVFYSLYLFFSVPINDLVVFIFPLIYVYVMATDHFGLSLFWISILSILFVSTIGVSTHIFSTIFSHQLPLLSTPGLYRAIYIITSNLILSIVIFSASKIRKDIFGLSWPVMFVFLYERQYSHIRRMSLPAPDQNSLQLLYLFHRIPRFADLFYSLDSLIPLHG